MHLASREDVGWTWPAYTYAYMGIGGATWCAAGPYTSEPSGGGTVLPSAALSLTCQTEINPAVVPVNLRVLTEQSGISG